MAKIRKEGFKNIGKPELVNAMAEGADLQKKNAEKALNILMEKILNEVCNGNTVILGEIGRIGSVFQKEKSGKNPKNGEPYTKYAHYKAHFSPSKQIEEQLMKLGA